MSTLTNSLSFTHNKLLCMQLTVMGSILRGNYSELFVNNEVYTYTTQETFFCDILLK